MIVRSHITCAMANNCLPYIPEDDQSLRSVLTDWFIASILHTFLLGALYIAFYLYRGGRMLDFGPRGFYSLSWLQIYQLDFPDRNDAYLFLLGSALVECGVDLCFHVLRQYREGTEYQRRRFSWGQSHGFYGIQFVALLWIFGYLTR